MPGQRKHERIEEMKEGGKPAPTHDMVAEQLRESEESRKAKAAEASIRDRMVDIGRGNQQSGRQNKS